MHGVRRRMTTHSGQQHHLYLVALVSKRSFRRRAVDAVVVEESAVIAGGARFVTRTASVRCAQRTEAATPARPRLEAQLPLAEAEFGD